MMFVGRGLVTPHRGQIVTGVFEHWSDGTFRRVDGPSQFPSSGLTGSNWRVMGGLCALNPMGGSRETAKSQLIQVGGEGFSEMRQIRLGVGRGGIAGQKSQLKFGVAVPQ